MCSLETPANLSHVLLRSCALDVIPSAPINPIRILLGSNSVACFSVQPSYMNSVVWDAPPLSRSSTCIVASVVMFCSLIVRWSRSCLQLWISRVASGGRWVCCWIRCFRSRVVWFGLMCMVIVCPALILTKILSWSASWSGWGTFSRWVSSGFLFRRFCESLACPTGAISFWGIRVLDEVAGLSAGGTEREGIGR